MLLNLIRREIVGNVLSLRFMVTFVLFFVLVLVTVPLLSSEYQSRLRTHEASKAAHREQLTAIKGGENQDEEFHSLLYGGGGIYGDRAPQPLGVFIQGIDDDLPSQVNTSLWGSRKVNEDFFRNPLLELFAVPDLHHIVSIVVSLLALLFAFDAICGEKERGTLKLVLANSVPRDLVLLSKWIGGYVCLSLPFLVALLAGISYVYLTGAIRFGGETVERLLWVILLSLLYVSVFFALGMMISAVTHKASTALLVSLFAWVCWILVIPNLSPVIAKILSPVPSLQKIKAEKAAVDRETEIRMQRVSRDMLGYGKKAEKIREKIEREGVERNRRLDQFYSDKLQRQIDLSKNLSRISPSGSFTYAVTDLANTGTGLFSAFKTAYRRFDEGFEEWGGDWDREFHDNGGKIPDQNWLQLDVIPSMQMIPLPLDDAIAAAQMDILLLLVFNVLFFMLSYVFFLRYDVT